MRRPHPIRDCWLAVNLSGILPGMGQCYGDQWTKGLVIMALFCALTIHALWSLLAAEGNTMTAFWLAGFAALVYSFNLWDAFATVGRPLHPLGNKRQGLDIWYGVFLSQILPGLGHLYLRQALMGGIFLAVGVGLAMTASFHPAVLPIACTTWSMAGYHAYRTTPKQLGLNPTRSSKMLMLVVVGSLALRLGLGSLPLWIDQTVMQCIVPSESMTPTLQVDDRIFVSRNAHYHPDTGDVVVFTAPDSALSLLDATPETLFVKRIIGLPGQEISIRDQQVWINKVPLEEPYVDLPARYRWGPEMIPPDQYVVLGDNRNWSADSSVWGFLPRESIIGEAYKIYWPPERVRSLRTP